MPERTRPRWLLAVPIAGVLIALALGAVACGRTAPGASPGAGTDHPRGTPMSAAPPNTTSSSAPSTTVPPTSTSAPSVSSPVGIVVGPGPQAVYAVQPQPAPGSCHYASVGPYPLPDPRCTPGAVNPQVTQDTIASTICVPGYTATIRPPESVTEPEKRASAAAYGYTGSLHTAEYDHLIPLELGGDPNDPANLWVEPNDRPGATTTFNSKDALESVLRRLVCTGRMTLAVARGAMATNWVAAAQAYG